MKLSDLPFDTKRTAWPWAIGGLISIILLGLVLAQIEWRQAGEMVREISATAMLVVIALLIFEGVFTAVRIFSFSGPNGTLAQSLEANAWYVILLVMLPARLGEVAAVFVFEKYLGMKRGAAVVSIIVQRLYDLVVLSIIFVVALLGLTGSLETQIGVFAALAVIGIAASSIYFMDALLTLAFHVMASLGGRRSRFGRPLLRMVLQARLWSRRDGSHAKIVGPALLITALKWGSNLAALVVFLIALNLPLSLVQMVSIAAAFNFLAIIPLQTIGGIGIGEAGLTLLLVAAGITTSVAASASVMLRLVIVLFPFLFWLLVMGGLKLGRAHKT